MARLARFAAPTALLLGLALRSPAQDAAAVVPPGSAMSGWKMVGSPKTYTARNLFDLIDGEAEAILAYDFVRCVHAEYAQAGASKPTLTVDVFQMRNDLNAFGVFGSDRQSGQKVDIGTEGVKISTSGLNFWQGPFVVRCTIVKVDAVHTAALERFARSAAARIQAPRRLPVQVAALPPGLQPRSEKFVRTGLAGQSYLTDAVTARYPKAGFGAEVFVCTYPTPAAAKAAFEKYRAYEQKNGTGLKAVAGVGTAAFSVQDRYAKNVAAAHKGSYVAGVIRAKDAASALQLLRQAVARL